MRIKSGVFYWLAVASGAVGMLYALGFAGSGTYGHRHNTNLRKGDKY